MRKFILWWFLKFLISYRSFFRGLSPVFTRSRSSSRSTKVSPLFHLSLLLFHLSLLLFTFLWASSRRWLMGHLGHLGRMRPKRSVIDSPPLFFFSGGRERHSGDLIRDLSAANNRDSARRGSRIRSGETHESPRSPRVPSRPERSSGAM